MLALGRLNCHIRVDAGAKLCSCGLKHGFNINTLVSAVVFGVNTNLTSLLTIIHSNSEKGEI
jgi:hypothetical protein